MSSFSSEEALASQLLAELGFVEEPPDLIDLVREGLVPRLHTVRGRPTDPSWEMVRLLPMSEATWEGLQQVADSVSTQKRKVAAGQVAAFLLEELLPLYEIDT